MTIETKGNLRSPDEEEEKKESLVKYDRGINSVKGGKTFQGSSQVVQRKFSKKALNPDNLEKSGAQSQKDKNEGKQPSVSDQFFEAIGFFMPTIVGGAVGGIIEGSEGALAGAELGMKAGKQFADYKIAQQARQDKLNEQELKRKERMRELKKGGATTKMQQANEWMTTDKKPVVFDPDKGVYIDPETKEAVPASKLMSAKNYRQNINTELRKEGYARGDVSKLMQSQKELFNPKSVTGSKVKRLMEIDKLDRLLDSNANFKGLIESAMAKGLGGEVGNLAVEERQAAANLIGWKGTLNDFTEAITSRLGSFRKEEIKKLLKYIKPRIQRDVRNNLKNQAKGLSSIIDMPEDKILNYYKSTAGIDIGTEEVRKEGRTSAERKANWDEEKKKRYEEYLKNRRRR